ncbi:MAG: response regulator transcription factor [Kangiellaceae bacterium]|nr:response regulator transcription factor [Kangiellaceae bacterium]
MTKLIIKYALILFVALSGLKFLEYQFFSYKMSLESYLGIIAGIFLLAGIIIASYWAKYSQQDKHSPTDKDIQRKALNEQNNSSTEQSIAGQIDQQKLSEFSEREQQVLQLLCHGYTNKEIAQSLEISPNTVKTHMSRLFSKLGVSNRTQASSEAKLLKLII